MNVDQSLQLIAMPASRFSFQAATDLDIGLELPLQADSISYCALDNQYMHCQFHHNGRPFLSSSVVLFQDNGILANKNLVFPSVFHQSTYCVKYKGAPETGPVSGGRILADGELVPKQVILLEEDACFNIYHPVIAKRREALRQKRLGDKKTNKAVMYHKP